MIQNGQIQVRTEKLQQAVGFENDVLSRFNLLANARHGVSQTADAGAYPQRSPGPGGQEAGAVGPGGRIPFRADGNGVLVRLTVAGLAVGTTESMTELGDFTGRPVSLRQPRDQAS